MLDALPLPTVLAEAFAPAFMQRALWGGLLAVAVCSVVGTWVVLRGMAFLGDALSHGLLPGLAVGFLLGGDPVVGAFASAVVMVGALALVDRHGGVSQDTGIGLLFVAMLAVGVIVISRADRFATDLSRFLFGDVLGVTEVDLRRQLVAVVVVAVVCAVAYRAFLALAFHPAKAATLGLRPSLAHLGMLLVLALAIVTSFQTVGSLLVFGLLVGPPATATTLVRRVPVAMGLSGVVGAAAVVGGLALSFHHDTAAGATIAVLAVAPFFLIVVVRAVRSLATAAVRASSAGPERAGRVHEVVGEGDAGGQHPAGDEVAGPLGGGGGALSRAVGSRSGAPPRGSPRRP